MTPASAARRYSTVLGLAAGLVALTQALIAGSFAASSQASVLSLQQALVSDANGGGADFEPFLVPLVALFAFFYLTAGLSALLSFGFCWYAGRLAGQLTDDARAGADAGRRVTLLASAVWTAGTLIVAVVFHADGSFAWAIATLALVLAAPSGFAPSGVYVTQPGGAFLTIQAVVLLLQALVGSGIALAFGMLAGRMGASGSPQPRATAGS